MKASIVYCLLHSFLCLVLFPLVVHAVGEGEEEEGGADSDGAGSDGADSGDERVHGMVQAQISKSGTGISKASLQRYDTFINPKKKWMKVSFESDYRMY